MQKFFAPDEKHGAAEFGLIAFFAAVVIVGALFLGGDSVNDAFAAVIRWLKLD